MLGCVWLNETLFDNMNLDVIVKRYLDLYVIVHLEGTNMRRGHLVGVVYDIFPIKY